MRAALLTAAFLLPLAVIGGRVAFIQLTCGDAVLAGRDRPTAREEFVPAADGRVLSADGRVWAWDEAPVRGPTFTTAGLKPSRTRTGSPPACGIG